MQVGKSLAAQDLKSPTGWQVQAALAVLAFVASWSFALIQLSGVLLGIAACVVWQIVPAHALVVGFGVEGAILVPLILLAQQVRAENDRAIAGQTLACIVAIQEKLNALSNQMRGLPTLMDLDALETCILDDLDGQEGRIIGALNAQISGLSLGNLQDSVVALTYQLLVLSNTVTGQCSQIETAISNVQARVNECCAGPDKQPDGSTESSTEVSTENSTEASSEASTENSTETSAVNTEASTEAPTETSTAAVTVAPTEASTEVTTEAFTEVMTEASTEASSASPTEASTELCLCSEDRPPSLFVAGRLDQVGRPLGFYTVAGTNRSICVTPDQNYKGPIIGLGVVYDSGSVGIQYYDPTYLPLNPETGNPYGFMVGEVIYVDFTTGALTNLRPTSGRIVQMGVMGSATCLDLTIQELTVPEPPTEV
jgi:hypothetical protein